MTARERLALATRLALSGLLATSLLLAGGAGAIGSGVAPVAAATPDLTLVSKATYVVQPAAGKVAVSVAITATNHLHDTTTKRFYFRTAYLAVPPSTTGFHLATSGGSPSVAVSRRTASYTLLRMDFGSNLASGATRQLTLTFQIKDPGGAPDRPIRISPSLVSFYAWAFATPSTPGSSIAVTFPSGYEVTVGRGPLQGPVTGTDGSTTWASGPLAAPLSFVADLTADHPSDYVDAPRTVQVGGTQADLVLRSWPDDAAWRTRVGDLVASALPLLSQDVGLAWPAAQSPLVIQEALVRTTGGYSGLFDPSQHRVEIAYAAPPSVVLHEAAHAWFNGSLVADRWAAEAFASYYAAVAAGQLKLTVTEPTLDDAARAAAIPLNAWGPVGSEPPETEVYAYAASLTLAQAIAERAGTARLQKVWQDAAAGVGAYQPAIANGATQRAVLGATPEPASGPPDWRGLLDLLEEDTGQSYSDLWRTWVVRPEDLPALDARGTARAAYAKAVTDANGWVLPRSIRDALRAWQFDAAEQQLAAAEAVLGQRTGLGRAAAAASVSLPRTLQTDFESGNLSGAAAEAAGELVAIGTIVDASRAAPASPSALASIGLLGAAPTADLNAARAAFAAGDIAAAQQDATQAKDAWTSAESVGRGRIVSAIALAVALGLFIGLVLGNRRRRRAAATPAPAESDETESLHSAP